MACRGVGLDAVRVYLCEAGCAVTLVTETGHGTKLTITPRFSASSE